VAVNACSFRYQNLDKKTTIIGERGCVARGRHCLVVPFVGYFEVRLDLVGALGHAVEEAFLDGLVDAQPEELYLVRGFFLECLLER
jgi:hypothetical protein